MNGESLARYQKLNDSFTENKDTQSLSRLDDWFRLNKELINKWPAVFLGLRMLLAYNLSTLLTILL
jgi:hypothetical protein